METQSRMVRKVRCQCRNLDCARGSSDPSAVSDRWVHSRRCGEDATTLVGTGSNPIKDIPFCAACAEYHERGAK